jgi:hypothetical protein
LLDMIVLMHYIKPAPLEVCCQGTLHQIFIIVVKI